MTSRKRSSRNRTNSRRLTVEMLENRTLLAGDLLSASTQFSPWQNPLDSSDLNADGSVTPLDAIQVVNALNRGQTGPLEGRFAPPVLADRVENAIQRFLDANGDGQLTPSDALQVVNVINRPRPDAPAVTLPSQDQHPDQIGEDVPLLNLTRGLARVYAALNSVGDVDVFRVIPERNRLSANLLSFSKVEMKVAIVDASGEELGVPRILDLPAESAALRDVAVTPGATYFVVVSARPDVTGNYALQVVNYGDKDYEPLVATHFELRMAPNAISGVATTVHAVALNARNHPVPGYTGMVRATSSDANAVLPTEITFREGYAAFDVTFATVGEQTLTLTDTADASLTVTRKTRVLAQAVTTQFAVRLPMMVPTGMAVPVAVIALDAANRPMPNYNGTVSVSSSDANAVLPAEVVVREGRAVFDVTFATLGEQRLTVTDTANDALTSTAVTNVVTPAVATQIAVRLPTNVRSGSAIRVEAFALSADARLVPGYTGTVKLISSDASAVLPAEVTFREGRAVFEVTFATLGEQTLTISDIADETLTGLGVTNVVAPSVATQIVVRLPMNVPSGSSIRVEAVALNAARLPVSSYTGTARVISSDTRAVFPAEITFREGRAVFEVTFATQGEQRLTVTDTAVGTLTGSEVTNVVAPAVATQIAIRLPMNVPSGSAIRVEAFALNADARQVPGYTGTVKVISSDARAVFPAEVTFREGRAVFEVTFATQGEQTLTVTDTANATLTGIGVTNVVDPAVATQFLVRLPMNVPRGSAIRVEAVALNAAGLPLPSYTGTAKVISSDASAVLPAEVTFREGRAAFNVTFATLGEQTLTVTDTTNATLTGAAVTNVVAPAVATRLVVRLPLDVPKGIAVPVTVVALDAASRPVPSYSGTVKLTSSDARAVLPAEITLREGYASFLVTFATEGEQTLTVTDLVDASLTSTAVTYVDRIRV